MGAVTPPPAADAFPPQLTGRLKVVSVDYRLAPRHRHPSAMQDVLTALARGQTTRRERLSRWAATALAAHSLSR
ncbi:alpha/beta hydrolase fold domain-containing protein [Micromonospora sp. NBC_01655]|uniref:alpha/beta hydrolase fold domain-containing protein n=1 Tax=Micromonospora sp. NBC_01655 TaxID=2975983 RepID=UPI00338DFAC5